MIQLYDYQEQYMAAITASMMKGNKHILVTAPTGSGKTVMFSYLGQKTSLKNKRVLILTDRWELLNQTGGTLKQFGLNPFYIQAGCKYINYNNTSYVAMVKTLKNRLRKPLWLNWLKNNIDLIIIDEAHRQDFNYLFEVDFIKQKFVLGFTATPRRSGKMRQLALDYDDLISITSVAQLVRMNKLVRDDYFGIGSVDTDSMKVDSKTGDFASADMFKKFNSSQLYSGVVKNWLEIAKDTKTLIFCVNIEHAIQTCEEFQKNGIDARFLVSSMSVPKAPADDDTEGKWIRYEEKLRIYKLYKDRFGKWSGQRTSIINKFQYGEFKVLINSGILTTGFDDPKIETVVVNRSTMSVSLWLQMVGRGSRISPNKHSFNILDFGDNAGRLGHYTQDRIWSLWHEGTKGTKGVPPVKECGHSTKGPVKSANGKEGCMRMIMASIVICPFCGFQYPKKSLKEIELENLAYDSDTKVVVKSKPIKKMTDEELNEYWKLKKHNTAWLWRQLWFRGGESKINEFAEKFQWQEKTVKAALTYVNNALKNK